MKTCFILKLSPSRIGIVDLTKWEDKLYEVNRINVPEQYRGKGYGSELLKILCNAADEEGATLRLYPQASGPLSNEDLTKWYKRHGFFQKNLIYLYREPLLIIPKFLRRSED